MKEIKLESEQALIEQSIIAEVKKSLEEEPDKWLGFLNNFYTRVLPEGNEKWRTKRESLKKIGYWDKKNKDTTQYPSDHSDLWLDQTSKEFYETINKVIDELDTDGQIKQAINRFCNVTNYDERGRAQNELEEKLIPVFARLVAMGYTRHELIG